MKHSPQTFLQTLVQLEEILSIPGVGRRVLREFKKYRPYQNMEQFRREIGKYVDKNEVIRLERFVTLE